MNICVQLLPWVYVFISLGNIPRTGFAGSYGDSVEKCPNCFPKQVPVPFYILPAVYKGASFSTSSPVFVIMLF